MQSTVEQYSQSDSYSSEQQEVNQQTFPSKQNSRFRFEQQICLPLPKIAYQNRRWLDLLNDKAFQQDNDLFFEQSLEGKYFQTNSYQQDCYFLRRSKFTTKKKIKHLREQKINQGENKKISFEEWLEKMFFTNGFEKNNQRKNKIKNSINNVTCITQANLKLVAQNLNQILRRFYNFSQECEYQFNKKDQHKKYVEKIYTHLLSEVKSCRLLVSLGWNYTFFQNDSVQKENKDILQNQNEYNQMPNGKKIHQIPMDLIKKKQITNQVQQLLQDLNAELSEKEQLLDYLVITMSNGATDLQNEYPKNFESDSINQLQEVEEFGEKLGVKKEILQLTFQQLEYENSQLSYMNESRTAIRAFYQTLLKNMQDQEGDTFDQILKSQYIFQIDFHEFEYVYQQPQNMAIYTLESGTKIAYPMFYYSSYRLLQMVISMFVIYFKRNLQLLNLRQQLQKEIEEFIKKDNNQVYLQFIQFLSNNFLKKFNYIRIYLNIT